MRLQHSCVPLVFLAAFFFLSLRLHKLLQFKARHRRKMHLRRSQAG